MTMEHLAEPEDGGSAESDFQLLDATSPEASNPSEASPDQLALLQDKISELQVS